LKEPEKALDDEFADLHLKLPVLEVLAHVPMYDALLDKYIVSLELGKIGFEYIQSVAPKKMKDPRLFIFPCRLRDSKPFDTLADLGSCVNLLSLKLFKKLKVGLLEETDDVLGLADGSKTYPVGIVKNVEVHVGKLKLFKDFHVVDMEREPTCPLLVGRGFLATANVVIDCKKAKITVGEGLPMSIFGVNELNFAKDAEESEDSLEEKIDWNRPPMEGDGAWHIRIELIDPNGEKFDWAFQSIPTNRKLSLKENPSDILDNIKYLILFGGNIMDGVDIDNLTIKQYLRLTQESQTPKKIEDMTIAEYLEYEKKVNENHISNTKSYLLTYFSKSIPTYDPIREFAHYFGPNQPGAKSDCDSEDMEEEVEYMTDDEVVMSKQEESNHGYTQNIQHLEENDDVDKWLNAKITKHMTSVSDEVSSITSNEVDKADDNTSNTAPCRLPKELSPGSFLLPFNINNHNFYATTTLDAKDNVMLQIVYEYLGLDKLRGPDSLSPDRRGLVKRWHVCKPIHVTYDDGSSEDCGMWPICDPDSKFCFGYNEVFGVNEQGTLRQWICFRDHERRAMKGSYMGFPDFLQVRYGQQKIDDTTRE
ncbi:phospholipase-like protein, partial [Tanacetum coccineum]